MIEQKDALENAIVRAAEELCVAAVTAPKACGRDSVAALILTGVDIARLADRMEEIEKTRNKPNRIFERDAALLRDCPAVVLLGQKRVCRALNCGLCGKPTCAQTLQSGGHCAFDDIDLGIALGSAAALAADKRIDNRILYTAGCAAMELKLMGEEMGTIIALPLSADARNQFFIRT